MLQSKLLYKILRKLKFVVKTFLFLFSNQKEIARQHLLNISEGFRPIRLSKRIQVKIFWIPLTILQDEEAIESLPTAAQYTFMFRNLILIQGLFAGLAIGKMAEGALIAWLKLSLIMTIGGILIFTLFI